MISTLLRFIAYKTTIYRKLTGKLRFIIEKLHWKARIKLVLLSPYLKRFKQIQNSGKFNDHHQLMHQGIKVPTHLYCGNYMTQLIKKSKGVHEPEEEYYYSKIIEQLDNESAILELGSYWAYYSAWFLKKCPEAKSVCLEANTQNLEVGKLTYSLNEISNRGTFLNGFIAKNLNLDKNIYTVDYLMDHYFTNELTILHSDIQGHEYDMLLGAYHTLKEHKIKFIFLSTHSNSIHLNCKNYLADFGYTNLVDIPIKKSSSFDGFLLFTNTSKKINL